MIKYGKNAFMKGIFPWLANWFFNFVGTSVIKKGSTLEESVVTDRNVNIGKMSGQQAEYVRLKQLKSCDLDNLGD